MRALVTGCAGFIGSHLTESLLDDGVAVLGVDCFNENYGRRQKLVNLERAREWDAFEFVPVDLARGDLHELVGETDVVFHLAAEPGVGASWDGFERYVRNNVFATQLLLEASRARPERRFVYASSSSVYGDQPELPAREDARPRPLSPYGTTKLAGEHLGLLYHANFGVDAVILRYFSVYGPRQRPDMAFRRFCEAALADAPIELYGDGDQTRDFTFVDDVIAATRAAAERDGLGGRIFNVGDGSPVSINAAVRTIEDLAGRPLRIERSAPRTGDVHDTSADITAARAALGYAPSTAFADGIRAQWEWASERAARHAA
jgi:UDP-glucose 4-epimerase